MRKAILIAILTVLVLAAPIALASRSVTVTWVPTATQACNSGVAPGQSAACFTLRSSEQLVSLQFTDNLGGSILKRVEFWGTGLGAQLTLDWNCGATGSYGVPAGAAFLKVFFDVNAPGVTGPPGVPAGCNALSAPTGGSVTATIS